MDRERTEQVSSPPLCVAVAGLPGTGKSTVARLLAQRLGAVWLRSDALRKELFPRPAYTPAESQATYQELLRRAEAALARGQSVVLDATFRRRALRQAAREMASRRGARWLLVWVTAPEAQVRDRLASRRGDLSDADYSIYLQLQSEVEPLGDDEPHVSIDNRGTLQELEAQIRALAQELMAPP